MCRPTLIGARGDYVRTDGDIRRVRDAAQRGLDAFDLPGCIDPALARDPWRWDPAWMNAAWLRGVRDLLNWVLGDRDDSPLRGVALHSPPLCELDLEDELADEVARQGRPGGTPADPDVIPPPQYGEAIQSTTRWLRGETQTPPTGTAYGRPINGPSHAFLT